MIRKSWWVFPLFIAIVLLAYHKGFVADYVLWDDDALITNNTILQKDFEDAVETAFTIYYHGDYFPVTLLSYWTDYQIAGASSVYMHSVNLVLQVLNVCLLFVFLARFMGSPSVALLISLFYAIHPLQTESVMWVSERKSLISAFFTFLSLVFYLETNSDNLKKRRIYWGLALLTFVLASLAKATSILLPVLFVLIDLMYFKEDKKRILLRALPVSVAAVFLMAMRYKAYAASVEQAANAMWLPERLMHVPLMAMNAIGFYIEKFFWPFDFSPVYPNYEFTTPVIFVSSIVFVGMMALTWFILKTKNWFAMFFYLWMILFLLPVLQIVPRINYVNDRYMYLPIIGFVGMFFSIVGLKFFDNMNRKVFAGVVAGLILLMGGISYSSSDIWVKNRSLWQQAIVVFPGSVIARNNLGLDYQGAGEYDKAVEQYDLILKFAGEDQSKLLAYNNLANIYSNPTYKKYDPQRSANLLIEALGKVTRKRDSYESRANLGIILKRMQRNAQARQVFEAILLDLQTEPDFRFQWMKPLIETHLNSLPR